ncbi:hypothetical protein CU560_26335 [Serratia ureilytica]|nr:hypothetical protein CU560_26335 [Serratia ureilytica]
MLGMLLCNVSRACSTAWGSIICVITRIVRYLTIKSGTLLISIDKLMNTKIFFPSASSENHQREDQNGPYFTFFFMQGEELLMSLMQCAVITFVERNIDHHITPVSRLNIGSVSKRYVYLESDYDFSLNSESEYC